MRLTYLAFDAMISIPGGKLIGEGSSCDMTDNTFRAVDGWDLRRVERGVFTLRAAHMPHVLTIESSECQYFELIENVQSESVQSARASGGKRR